MALVVDCPFCKRQVPFRRDKRGGRYFRCGECQTASFFSGRKVIDALEGGGTWSFTVSKESGAGDKGENSASFLSEFFGE